MINNRVITFITEQATTSVHVMLLKLFLSDLPESQELTLNR